MRALRAGIVCWAAMAAPGAERLTLKDAEELALRSHPRLATARHLEAAAQEGPAQARARLRPQVNVSSSAALAEDSNTRIQAGGLNNPLILNRWAAGAAVNQLLMDFGRTKYLTETAERRAEAANAVVRTTRAGVLLRVHRAYFAALGAQAVRKVAAETVAARDLVVSRAAALAENKLRSELDVIMARVDLQEARLLESNAENAFRSALVDLSTALGLESPGDYELVEEPLPAELAPDPDAAAREALGQRPELAQARAEEAAAAAFTKAERAARFPTIGGTVTTGVTPFHNSRLQGHWNAAGIVMELPFLNGGLLASRRREAEARERAAASNRQDVARQLSRDARIAYLGAVTAFDRLQLTAGLVNQARQSFDLAKARYDLGLSSIVELSQAQLGLTRAEIAQASARFEYQAARAALQFERGGF